MCIGGPKLLRQGYAKAVPNAPKGASPELILGLLDANFATLASILDDPLLNCTSFVRIFKNLNHLEQIFNVFNMV